MMPELQKLEPMLAKLGSVKDLSRKYFIYEPYLGGTRALVYKSGDHIRILNRKGMWIEFRYPELLELVKNIDAKSAVIDGEIIVLDAKGARSYAKLEMREHLSGALEIETKSKESPATFVAFDVLMRNNRWYTDRPLYERKKVLDETVRDNAIVKKSQWSRSGTELFREAKKKKLEGVVGKNINSRYEEGKRSGNWIKIQAEKTLDCVVVGWKEGKKPGFMGSLALGIYKDLHLYYIGTIGGFSDEFAKIWQPRLNYLHQKKPPVRNTPENWEGQGYHWLKPSLVCEIEFSDLVKMELKGAVFRRMRSDKEPQSCTLGEQVRAK